MSGKHSMERKKSNKKAWLILLLIIIIGFGGYLFYTNKDTVIDNNKEKTYTIKPKTIEGEKLVIKSNSEDNRYIEFFFENNVLSKLKIYEQFEDKDKYEENKEQYSSYNIYKIVKSNNKKLILEVEKTDLEDDKGLNYEEIYDKYVNKIIGAYEVIE